VDHDILILGAGVAGLSAARQLAETGARVCVLEARDRIGGRIWTQHIGAPGGEGSMPVELGAEFIHGVPQETFSLLHEAGLSSYELDGEAMQFVDGRLVRPQSGPSGFELIGQLQQWLDAQPAGFDLSFEQYLERMPPAPSQRQDVVAFVEGFNAADSRVVSIASLNAQQRTEDAEQGDRRFHVAAGYDAVPGFLAQRLERAGGTLRLESVVRRIDWKPGEVSVRGTDGAGAAFGLTAAQAVIALPLGVLQSGSVEFSPVPAAAMDAARRLAFGAAFRMTLVFRHAFWRDLKPPVVSPQIAAAMQQLSFVFANGETPRTWWTATPNRAPTITAWVGGPRAVLPHELWLDRCVTTLARIMGQEPSSLRQLLVSAHSHDWLADPFCRGAYSYVPVGAMAASEQMSQPIQGTLFFAGEHTDLTFSWGTVHAALRSGLRAARQLSVMRA
jgi:monoamine oxidase